MRIEDLADFPALQQIEKALWKQGKTRGAAVLIGAGFSRNAELSYEGAALPPLWSDFAQAMEERLNHKDCRMRDPLRTAEEFRAVLGEPALEGLIRELVQDDQWTPGALHKKLVALPWFDILTTNWDTLLERTAATTLGQTYETVRCLEDIATTRQPRIVKLHGSLPSNRPFILSEEDYRTYPKKFAPFVNLVQQVLLENELCLLGFSGDDPNFLQWSGWVRDQLGVSARRIYLVGALHLDTAQRRLLEQRNVSPIDLSPLVAEVDPSQRHRAATELFLERLHSHRPRPEWEWNCHRETSSSAPNRQAGTLQVATALSSLATEWAKARVSYPGWAICPPDLRRELKMDTVHAFQNMGALAAMPPTDRAKLCYETAWRLDTALLPVRQWETELTEVVENASTWGNAKQRNYVITLLLRNAREDRNATSFEKWATELERQATADSEVLSWLTYERCLWDRDALDFKELEKRTPTLKGSDPLWGLRRAALYAYLGNFDAARADVEQVISQTRSLFLRNRNSIWALSRFAWAHFCAGSLRTWDKSEPRDEEFTSLKLRIHEAQCEPWDTLSDFDREIEESLRRHQEENRSIEARFEPGTYHDARKILRFRNSPGLVNYELDRFSDSVGIPLRTQNMLILSSRMERSESLAAHEGEADYLRTLRIVETDQPAALERRFGRIEVAKLPANLLAFLKVTLTEALEYAVEQLTKSQDWHDHFWSHRASVYLEILSRLLVRSEPLEALEWFRRGLAFSRDERWHHEDLFKGLGHLLERTLSAIPALDRTELLPEVLEFPLPHEISLRLPNMQLEWPVASEWLDASLMKRPTSDERISQRITSLVEMVRAENSETRKRSVQWLMRLHMNGVLTASESKQFGEALWSRCTSETGFPSDTNLRVHMFLLLPAPDSVNTLDLFKQKNHAGSSASYMISVAGATQARPDGSRYKLFEPSEALSWLEKFVDWQPEEAPLIDLNRVCEENKHGLRSLGLAIADAILPLFGPDELPPELVGRIFDRENDTLSIVLAYPEIVRLSPSKEKRAIQGIIRAMFSHENGAAWAGFNALFRWLQRSQTDETVNIPRRLIDVTISVVETRREPGLVHALNLAGHLLKADSLSIEDMSRLASALGVLYIETAYSTFDGNRDSQNTMWTLVRANSARLAGLLKAKEIDSNDLNGWIQDTPSDPMPEVRFALEAPFD